MNAVTVERTKDDIIPLLLRPTSDSAFTGLGFEREPPTTGECRAWSDAGGVVTAF